MTHLILDQADDANFRELHRLSRLYSLPNFVKQAAATDLVPEEKASRLFADSRQCRYPVHTKAATYVSTLYFLEKQAAFPPTVRKLISERLAKAAEYWHITPQIAAAVARQQELEKEAEYPDSTYALVMVGEDGGKSRHYPLRNSMEVKAAAVWFSQYLPQLRQQFPFEDRRTIASNILRKAAEFGADIGEETEQLEKCAGRGLGSPDRIANLIAERTKVAHKCPEGVKAALLKLAESARKTSQIFFDPNSLCKLASTIDQFDRAHNLIGHYSERVPAPEDVLFEATQQKMAELHRDACTTVTGSIYDRSQFEKLSLTDVQDVFGDEIVAEVRTGLQLDPEKFAAVAATFPRPDAALLDELMQTHGMQPLAKQSAESGLGFSFADYRAMVG